MTATRLASAIFESKKQHGIAFMPFIAAGFPDLETSLKLIGAFQRAGAAAIEVGFPFSDPVADGPTIQEAFTVALSKKLKIDQIFDGVERIKAQITVPLVAMVSFSIVFRYGVEKFIVRAKQSGFSGLILPDLPPPEGEAVCKQVQAGGLDTVLLIAPSTTPERREKIASLCSGFVYCLSVAGITGARDTLPPGVEENVRSIQKVSQVPVCVGFGVSKPEHLTQLGAFADGAIVASAIVKRMKEATGDPVAAAEEYCKQLVNR